MNSASRAAKDVPVGTLFVIGDSDQVLTQSHQLVINPFHGYPENERNILDPRLEETIKEFSAIDGAFVIRGDGVILAAGAYLAPRSKLDEKLPQGLGTRHEAAAGITAMTRRSRFASRNQRERSRSSRKAA